MSPQTRQMFSSESAGLTVKQTAIEHQVCIRQDTGLPGPCNQIVVVQLSLHIRRLQVHRFCWKYDKTLSMGIKYKKYVFSQLSK